MLFTLVKTMPFSFSPGSLLKTLFYLAGHLYQADLVIKYCIPGFALGISSGIIYFIGYRYLNSEQKDKKRPQVTIPDYTEPLIPD